MTAVAFGVVLAAAVFAPWAVFLSASASGLRCSAEDGCANGRLVLVAAVGAVIFGAFAIAAAGGERLLRVLAGILIAGCGAFALVMCLRDLAAFAAFAAWGLKLATLAAIMVALAGAGTAAAALASPAG